jgi:nitroreductase
MKTTIEILKSHRSIRKFSDQPVEDCLIEEIVSAAQCASTSHHVQAYAIIRVRNKSVRKQISDLAGPQIWVQTAPVFLVFCADLTRLADVCIRHGRSMSKGWAEQFVVATVDTALAAQNLMIAAESLGLGGVFIGGIRNDPDKVCHLLHIPDLAYPVFGMCLGYPDQPPEVKPRLPASLVLMEETFGCQEKERNDAFDAYDKTVRDYYLSRDSNQKDETWTGQMAEFMSQVVRPHMKSFLEKKGFFLR